MTYCHFEGDNQPQAEAGSKGRFPRSGVWYLPRDGPNPLLSLALKAEYDRFPFRSNRPTSPLMPAGNTREGERPEHRPTVARFAAAR